MPHHSSFSRESISKEIRLLLHCVRVKLDGDSPNALKALAAQPLDWDLVWEAARWHRLDPIAFHSLNAYCADLVPPPLLARLKRAFLENIEKNMLMAAALTKVLRAFGEANIPVLTLKGLPLMQEAHGDLGLRRVRDLDLLVPKSYFRQALSLLRERLGYRDLTPIEDSRIDLLLRTGKDVKLLGDGVLLELHWQVSHITALFPADIEGLVESGRFVTMGGTPTRVLGFTELVPYLCFHGTVHLWFRLFWLCDLRALANEVSLDWKTIVSRTTDLKQQRSLALAMNLCNRLLDSPIPKPVNDLIDRDPAIEKLTQGILSFLFQPPRRPYTLAVSERQKLIWATRLRKGLRFKVAVLYRYLVPPNLADTRLIRLPGFLFPLYYIIRPIRLLGRALLPLKKHPET